MVRPEVLVVLQVERGQGQVVGQAAGGDPHVVDRTGSAALDARGRQPAPHRRDRLVAEEDWDSGEPVGQFLPAAGTPVPDLGPLGQLAKGDEGDQRPPADEPRGQWAVSLRLWVSDATSVSGITGCTMSAQATSWWRSEYVKAMNSSSSSSDSKVSAARSSNDWIGCVFLAASSSSTDSRGRTGG